MHDDAMKKKRADAVRALGIAAAAALVTAGHAAVATAQPAAGAAPAEAATASVEAAGATTAGEDKYAWCDVRVPGKATPGVTYHFPEALAQVDTYSIAASLPARSRVIHFSGQIPINDQYAVEGESLTDQLDRVLKNLCIAMEDAGVTTADVYQLRVMYVHKDAADPFVLAEELRDFFARERPPATTMMAVPVLITEQIRVQVEASAIVSPGKNKPRRRRGR